MNPQQLLLKATVTELCDTDQAEEFYGEDLGTFEYIR